jgi:UDP-N-acetylmuramyl tripeptide synthase
MKVRFWLALWTGKVIGIFLKLLGKKGTTFPGFVALKICPEFIKYFASAFTEEIVLITGTNGKTTTNNLLASIFKTVGKRIAFNREGANMLTGITGTLLRNTSFAGKPQADLLSLEVDEATIPSLCEQLTPKIVVITNFFQDQLDRYGELDTTIKLVQNSLPPNTELILNADDPLVAHIGSGRTRASYYGAGSLPTSRRDSTENCEGRYCSHCGHELAYLLFHYGQLGIYHCPGCGFRRPEPYLEAQEVRQEDTGIFFRIDREYQIPLQGIYNLYNALAAFSVADRLGVAREDIRQGLLNFVSDAGRMEQFLFPGRTLTLNLVKNPTGFNQVINTLVGMNKPLHLLIAINDLAADGRDVSWLWDVDFELLASRQETILQIVCSGLRAEEIALRLKYSGCKEEKIILEHSLVKAVELLEKAPSSGDEAIFILPNYTLLSPIREILVSKRISCGQSGVVSDEA